MGPLRTRRASSAIPPVIADGTPACLTLPQRTGVSVLLTVSAAAIVAAPTGLAQRPAGWLLLGLAALVGLNPLARHALWGAPSGLALGPGARRDEPARLVRRAADEADALARLADRVPPGPVADHLGHLAATARGYVLALHEAAGQSRNPGHGPGRRDVELEATMARIVSELGDLSAAAARLCEAQRQHLLSSPLVDLAAATDALTATIESGQLR